MTEKPTEDTYTTELVSTIKSKGEKIGFDAETNYNTPSGKPDIKLLWNGQTVAIIEVKRPDIPLSDPELKKQAFGYADWYHKNFGVNFYGVHNMKYLKLWRCVKKPLKERNLLDFVEPEEKWKPVSDFPFKIIPWAESIRDFKEISTNTSAKQNLERFLIKFKEILTGKSIDLSEEVISTISSYIEDGTSAGLSQLENLYKNDKEVRNIFYNWISERGYKKPNNDNEARKMLRLMLKEQLYTFSMKILFYSVLQSIDSEMASKLQENITNIKLKDPALFKKIFDTLFEYAIDRTGDFEEVFGSNAVDKLPFVIGSLPHLNNLIHYLNQIRWSDINVDIIGRIFEGLIYEERRHLLGQHFTETKVVDLILSATLREPKKLLDPSCGSGTFSVRAINYWRAKGYQHVHNLVECVDIDKLAVLLSKINLYVQALNKIKEGEAYVPSIHHNDIFKLDLKPEYGYVVTNPPYTRQEEMSLAYYNKDYKKIILDEVKDIEGWSRKASIYAYFLVKGGNLLQKGGRLGYIIENSWMNAEYGKSLKKWLLDNFSLEIVIESLVEKWFEDADIITNIIIAEKNGEKNETHFIFLKKKILDNEELINNIPPATDYTANQRYYEKIEELLNKIDLCKINKKKRFGYYEDDNFRIAVCRKSLLEDMEKKLGRWGVFKAPKRYLELIVDFLNKSIDKIILMEDILDIKYGLKTNANEIFYLPSKHWKYVSEKEDYLILSEVGGTRKLKLSKEYLRPLIRLYHIEDSSYSISKLKRAEKENYVVWVENVETVTDNEMRDYLNWAEKFIRDENKQSSKFPTIVNQLDSADWTKLPDTSNAQFLFKNAIHKTFAIYINEQSKPQVDKRLFMGYLKENINPKIVFASLNSVITYLGMELLGRTNLGQGVLDINIIDYKKIPIVNPITLEEELTKKGKIKKFINIVDKILPLKPCNIEKEVENKIRMKMEEYTFSCIGLSKDDLKELYEGLLELVDYRIMRANT